MLLLLLLLMMMIPYLFSLTKSQIEVCRSGEGGREQQTPMLLLDQLLHSSVRVVLFLTIIFLLPSYSYLVQYFLCYVVFLFFGFQPDRQQVF